MPFHSDVENLLDYLGDRDEEYRDGLIHIECEDRNEKQVLKQEVENFGFSHTQSEGTSTFSFLLSHDNFEIYYDEDDFLNSFHDSEAEVDIYLIKSNYNGPVKYDETTNKTLDQEGNNLSYYFFDNYFGYQNLKNVLDDCEIVDHKDVLNNQYILLSSKQGAFRLGYSSDSRDFNISKNLSVYPEKLQEELAKGNDYYRFLKEVMVSRLGDVDRTDRTYHLFIELDKYIDEANRNYEVFLNKFDFAKLKDELRHEKEKYLSSIQEVISDLFSKVVSIPISISAAAFALFRVKENPALCSLIVIGYVVYTIFTLYLLKVVWDDNQEIKTDFEDDIERIKESSPLTSNDVDDINSKMGRRFTILKTSIIFVAIILIGLGLAISIIGGGFIFNTMSLWLQLLVLTIPVSLILLVAGIIF